MNILWYILVSCVGSWGLVSWMVPKAVVEIFLGMLIPLLLGIGTIVLVKRTYQKDARRLTALLTKAFVGKMLLYGVYVAVIVGFYAFQPVPFAISFTVYFTGLHLAEALYLKTLFEGR